MKSQLITPKPPVRFYRLCYCATIPSKIGWLISRHILMRLIPISIVVAVCMAVVGCGSLEKYEEERRQSLLTIYPPGRTSRDDVRNKWGANRPRNLPFYYAATRPADGWDHFNDEYVRGRAIRSEQRIGQSVASLE